LAKSLRVLFRLLRHRRVLNVHFSMKSITDVQNLRGQYVLLRASLNVPVVQGAVINTYRLEQALPTLQYLHAAGARTIVIAHIGRAPTETLKPVLDSLASTLPVTWGGEVGSPAVTAARSAMADGDILLVENLRQHAGETAANPEFIQTLAELGDIYVNDAFANIHREHASMVGVAEILPAYAGLNVAREVESLQAALVPETPSLFMLGGAKFETKLPLIEKFLVKYDHVFVGGALLNDILVAKGYEIGQSMVSDISLQGMEFLTNPKCLQAVDVVVRQGEESHVVPVDQVPADSTIIDVGPATVELLRPYIASAKTILWNGPFGVYERGAEGSTHAVARAVAASSAHSIVGGGDTVAAISDLGLNQDFSFVSTGGGAMLTYLEQGTTRALEVLE